MAVPMKRERAIGRWGRLVAGWAALLLLFVGLTQAGRLPGAVGDAIRHNLESGRDATAMFYTDLHDWLALAQGASRVGGGSEASGARDKSQ